MATLEQDAQIEGFNELLDTSGRSLQWAGKTGPPVPFMALITSAPPIDPDSQLSIDVREKVLMQLLAPGPAIALGDTVIEPGTPNQWQAIWRDDNTADWDVEYILSKITQFDS